MVMENKFFTTIAKHRVLWLIVVASLGIFLDQASKIWIQKNLAEPVVLENNQTVFYPAKVIEVIPNFFNLIYAENPSAAFSLTRSIPEHIRRPMLVGISLIASIFFLIWYLRMKAQDGLLLASFSFILAGAIGNLIDRIRLGYVIDFLDMHLGFLGYHYLHWPTYNIADSLIVIGAIGVIIRTIWPYKS